MVNSVTGDLRVPLNPELEPFRADLELFMSLMVRKLHINRHKGFAEAATLDDLYQSLQAESAELDKALATEGQFEASMEAIDVANMAFLVASRCWSLTKPEYKETQNEHS